MPPSLADMLDACRFALMPLMAPRRFHVAAYADIDGCRRRHAMPLPIMFSPFRAAADAFCCFTLFSADDAMPILLLLRHYAIYAAMIFYAVAMIHCYCRFRADAVIDAA